MEAPMSSTTYAPNNASRATALAPSAPATASSLAVVAPAADGAAPRANVSPIRVRHARRSQALSVRAHYPKNRTSAEVNELANGARGEAGGGLLVGPQHASKKMPPTGPYLDQMVLGHSPLDADDVAALGISYAQAPRRFVVSSSSQQQPPQEPSADANQRLGGPLPSTGWRAAHAPPPVLPDLKHTGIRSAFTYQGPTYMRPDGSISLELHQGIAKTLRELPTRPAADTHDMSRVDFQRSVEKHNHRQQQQHQLSYPSFSEEEFLGSSASFSAPPTAPQTPLMMTAEAEESTASLFPGAGGGGGSVVSNSGNSVATDGIRFLSLPEPPASGMVVNHRFANTNSSSAAPTSAPPSSSSFSSSSSQRLGNNNCKSRGGSSGMGRHARSVLESNQSSEPRPAASPDTTANGAESSDAGADGGVLMKTTRPGRKKKKKQLPAAVAEKRPERRKKPFSNDSLFACLLDLEYGATDAKALFRAPAKNGGDESAGWDTAGVFS